MNKEIKEYMSKNGQESARLLKERLGENYKEFMAKKRRGKKNKKLDLKPSDVF